MHTCYRMINIYLARALAGDPTAIAMLAAAGVILTVNHIRKNK